MSSAGERAAHGLEAEREEGGKGRLDPVEEPGHKPVVTAKKQRGSGGSIAFECGLGHGRLAALVFSRNAAKDRDSAICPLHLITKLDRVAVVAVTLVNLPQRTEEKTSGT